MRGLRDLGLVAQPPHGLPRRREHLRSVASLACNVFPHAAVASPACNVIPFPTARKQSLLRSLLWEARSSLKSPCMEQSGMGTYVASPSFYPSFHRYHSPLMHDDDRFPVLTLSLSRSLVFFMFIHVFFSFDATVLLGPGGPSPTSKPASSSTFPGRTQPSL